MKRPVEKVSWFDAVEFCNKLSVLEELQEVYTISGRTPSTVYPITNAVVTVDWEKNGYRLPTEAEWEYACRAGTATAFNTGAAVNGDTGWYYANSDDKTHEVGLKPPNAWGLYDMHGNVYEWCWDWYGGDYEDGLVIDPKGANFSPNGWRMWRGGSWYYNEDRMRSAFRDHYLPTHTDRAIGIRLVRGL
jgi:formylglycine-generating enzyme required for sulfatase activity